MIVTRFEHLSDYAGLNQFFEKTFKWIQTTDLEALEDGDFNIFGDDVLIKVRTHKTKLASECKFFGHRKYIDVLLIVKGKELIEYAPIENLESVEPYNPQMDSEKFEGLPESRITHLPGTAVFLFPQDLHKPFLYEKDEPQTEIKTINIKVKI